MDHDTERRQDTTQSSGSQHSQLFGPSGSRDKEGLGHRVLSGLGTLHPIQVGSFTATLLGSTS